MFDEGKGGITREDVKLGNVVPGGVDIEVENGGFCVDGDGATVEFEEGKGGTKRVELEGVGLKVGSEEAGLVPEEMILVD